MVLKGDDSTDKQLFVLEKDFPGTLQLMKGTYFSNVAHAFQNNFATLR